MTEAEWLAWTEDEWLQADRLEQLGAYLEGKGHRCHAETSRKIRLFFCACCRRVWPLLTDHRSRDAVVTAERFADGLTGEEQLMRSYESARKVFEELTINERWMFRRDVVRQVRASWYVLCTVRPQSHYDLAYGVVLFSSAEDANPQFQDWTRDVEPRGPYLREIFGNPFRPVTVAPAWQTANVVALAQAIYDDSAFDRLPILADALEDAGCDNADILNHCRSGGEHVRGCWVVDLVLGKE